MTMSVQGFGMYDEGTATAGAPGTFAAGTRVPSNFVDLTGTTASPATAWTTGQHVILADTTHAYWNGSAWVVGNAP